MANFNIEDRERIEKIEASIKEIKEKLPIIKETKEMVEEVVRRFEILTDRICPHYHWKKQDDGMWMCVECGRKKEEPHT